MKAAIFTQYKFLTKLQNNSNTDKFLFLPNVYNTNILDLKLLILIIVHY